MARDFKRQNKLAVISDLNVTPLIDLGFSIADHIHDHHSCYRAVQRIDLPSQNTSQTSKAS